MTRKTPQRNFGLTEARTMVDVDIAITTAISVSITTAVFGALLWQRQKQRNDPTAKPTKWVRVGTVANLVLYPVKSITGIYVDSAIATPLGLQGRKGSRAFRDRIFLLIDAKGKEIAQNRIPEMIRISVSISEGDEVTLSAPDTDPVSFTIPENTASTRRICHIGTDKNLPCLDCGEDVGKWFQKVLGKDGLRLVCHVEDLTKATREITKDQTAYSTFEKSDIGVFQNETAFLLLAEESVADLNTRLETPVTHKNFRPTVIIKDIMEPFGELRWNYIKFGESDDGPILKTGRPCDRCPIVTNDPSTGVMDRTREVLKTLQGMENDMGYELANNLMRKKAVMGLRMGLYENTQGTLRVGDPVYTAVL